MLTLINFNSGTTVIVGNIVVDRNSSTIYGGFIALNDNPFAVRNLAGVGLVFVTDIILIVIKEVAVHKNLGSRAPVTVGALDGNAAPVNDMMFLPFRFCYASVRTVP